MAISTIGTASISALGYGFKNRVINGGMQIDQRNAGASVTPVNGGYTVDRWASFLSQSSKYTVQQNAGAVTPPAGFSNYLGVTSSSAYSVLTGDYFTQRQYIEGFTFADMAWGTASAAPITISFWVRSSLTGTFGGAIGNSAGNRSYPFTYTISSANTWEQKAITIAGDTTGTWVGATNGVGLRIDFSLGVGSTYTGPAGAWASANYTNATGATSVVGTSGATFYITGVQIEKGTVATSFDWRPYGTELVLCQRYYVQYNLYSGNYNYCCIGGASSSTNVRFYFQFPTPMRTNPTLGTVGNTYVDGNVFTSISSLASVYTTNYGTRANATVSGVSTGQTYFLANNSTDNASITISAEL